MNSVKVRVSGKLYWAGEHAIVEPGNTAILNSVNKFLTATFISTYEDFGTITTELSSVPIYWEKADEDIIFSQMEQYRELYYSLVVMRDFLLSCGRELPLFDVAITSELHDGKRNKFGFGSSGCITVAMVRGIAQLCELELSDLEVFKLASVITLKITTNTSLGDLAAITFGGLVAYTSFDRLVLAERIKTMPLAQVLENDWGTLEIKPLTNILPMRVLVGWTGSVASSHDLVGGVQRIKNTKEYRDFVQESQRCVESLIVAITTADRDSFRAGIIRNRELLANLGNLAGVPIETKQLAELANIAEHYAEVAKLSGAGGGDCGLAFVFKAENLEKIISDWQKHDITYLDV